MLFCTLKCYFCFSSSSAVYYRTSVSICRPCFNSLSLILCKIKWNFNDEIAEIIVRREDVETNDDGSVPESNTFRGTNYDDIKLSG
jgi:hypothetical protein